MSEATVNTIAEANAEMYDRLLVSIEAGIGLLQIFIAVCDADRQREQIITNYERELAPNIQHYRVELDRQEPSLRHAVASAVTEKESAVVTVLGAETLGLLGQNDESLDKFFGYLQWTREALREFQMPIVLWIPSRILKELAHKSPDFWSWRNGVFQFTTETSLEIVNIIDTGIDGFYTDEQPNSVLSVEQLESSLAKAIATWGKDSRHVAKLYAQIGRLYLERFGSGQLVNRERELSTAEDYFKRAIDIQTKLKQQEALATSLNDLGALYESMGRHNEAEPLCVRSLAINEKQVGANSLNTAISLNNLASLYKSMGKYSQAEPLYMRSLAIKKQQFGENHPATALSLNNLAGLYESIGRYSEAELLYLQALDIYEQQLGANYPNTANILNNLALLYQLTGRYAEAEPLYTRSLAISEKQLGTNDPATATSLNNMAGLYELTGRYEKADLLYARAVEILENILGTNHPKTQTCRNNLQGLRRSLSRVSTSDSINNLGNVNLR
ncbi:MAG: tetratricopeptide repeat protein [Chamaesiphon sp. CSU_1_12]|nr:tetratricopeptide repeat protein [Chamaesiphon sp. CSU_1_12]